MSLATNDVIEFRAFSPQYRRPMDPNKDRFILHFCTPLRFDYSEGIDHIVLSCLFFNIGYRIGMTPEKIILGFRLALSLMGRVWLKYNRVFNEFGFIFSNPRWIRGGFEYCYSPHPDYIFKIYFFIILFYVLI